MSALFEELETENLLLPPMMGNKWNRVVIMRYQPYIAATPLYPYSSQIVQQS
jgi:hypothetical protein